MIEPLELACCELLLELYRGARELSVAEFPGFAFGLLTAVLRFDTARYTALKFLDQGAVVCTSHYGTKPPRRFSTGSRSTGTTRWFRQC